ncbi:uncharacterized protein [Littorina saxatilis]|uniref:uncharacterized protein isoform X2 n=1 Tax=Littorina saxatilis TaxID=31220 RepID=UPI0038B65FA8
MMTANKTQNNQFLTPSRMDTPTTSTHSHTMSKDHGQTMAPGSRSQEDKVATSSREDTNTERAATTEITPEEDRDSLNHGASKTGGTFEVHEVGDIVISLPGEEETPTTEGTSRRKGKGSKNRGGDEDDASHNDDGDQDKGGGDDDDEHGHRKGLCEGGTSSQHNIYIQQHLEELQKKCDEFHECTIELYKAENFHRVLAGEPIQLKNICGLMYPDGEEMYKNGNESVKCSLKERAAIRQDIGRRLSTDMAKDKSEWKQLNECLKENRTADESDIDTLCGRTKKETSLCGNGRIHNKAEEFFNHEMEHLHCSCAAIREQKPTEESSPKLPLSIRIAVVSGVLSLIVILFIVVIVLCIRHRKVKKRLSQHRMKYMPSPHDEGSAIYQEINDCPPGLRNGKNEGNISGGYHFLGRAPSLPERYVKPQMARSRNNPNSPGEEEREYLEPLPDSGSGRRTSPAARANMGYGAPKNLAVVEPPYDLARNPANMSPTDGRPPKESNYFERLQPMNSVEDDGGYSTLGRKRVPPEEAHDDEVGAEESADGRQYFVLEPQDDAASEKDALTMVNSDASEFSGVQTAL